MLDAPLSIQSSLSNTKPLLRAEGAALQRACAAAANVAKYRSVRMRAQHFDPRIMECFVDSLENPTSGAFVEAYTGLIAPWSMSDLCLPVKALLRTRSAYERFEISCVTVEEESLVASLLTEMEFEYTKVRFEELVQICLPTAPGNEFLYEFEFSTLHLSDAEKVIEVWPYRTNGALDLLKYLITYRPSVALRRRDNGELVGWIQADADYSGGKSHVMPEYRSRGLMTQLIVRFGSELKKLGVVAYGYVHIENEPMVHALERAGYDRTFRGPTSAWFMVSYAASGQRPFHGHAGH